MSGVSVVLPVRNGGAFFEPALRSLVEQTSTDFEIVIHVDGSTDGSLEVAEGFARGDGRFVISAGTSQGVAHAANAAAARASGDLLVRMDADDVCHATRVEQLVAFAAANPDVGLMASRARYFPREVVGPGMLRYEGWLNSLLTHDEIYRDRYVEYPLPHPTTAIRRATFEQLGGYRHGDFPRTTTSSCAPRRRASGSASIRTCCSTGARGCTARRRPTPATVSTASTR